MTDEELLDLVGTTRPTAEQFHKHINGHRGNRHSWVGTYVVTYLDGQPHEIHFYGISGD